MVDEGEGEGNEVSVGVTVADWGVNVTVNVGAGVNRCATVVGSVNTAPKSAPITKTAAVTQPRRMAIKPPIAKNIINRGVIFKEGNQQAADCLTPFYLTKSAEKSHRRSNGRDTVGYFRRATDNPLATGNTPPFATNRAESAHRASIAAV